MSQYRVRRAGGELWLGARPILAEETRESINTYLELSGSTVRDLEFESADVRAEFEAKYGPV